MRKVVSKIPGTPCIKDDDRTTYCGKKRGPSVRVVDIDYNIHLLYGTMVCGECWRVHLARLERFMRDDEEY